MSVFRRKRKVGKKSRRDTFYSYDLAIDGERYRGSTGLTDKADAEEWETKEKTRIRRRLRGVAQDDQSQSMYLHDWAEEYRDIKADRGFVMGPIDAQLAVVLRFFGGKPDPTDGVVIEAAAPYHNLLLGDVLIDPYWMHRFDQWIRARDVNWQTRNHYRSRMSDLYAVANELAYRQRTGVTFNPFAGFTREPKKKKKKPVITPMDVSAWIAQASYHARLALAIGALAPKLRVASILALRWSQHFIFDADGLPLAIRVDEHKTDEDDEPQIYPVVDQLRDILTDARRRNPKSDAVVTYRGKPIKRFSESPRTAALAAGLTYGRFGGVTFHTLRQVAASLFATMDTNAFKQLDLMGWKDLRTPLYYTRVDAEPLRVEAERLSAQLPIAKAVMLPHTRAKAHRPMVGKLATLRPGSKRYQEAQADTASRAENRPKRRNVQ